jgi:hypothetical protein
MPLCLVKPHGDVRGSEGIAPRILNIGIKCRRVVSFIPRTDP